jgi:hypothetical protein
VADTFNATSSSAVWVLVSARGSGGLVRAQLPFNMSRGLDHETGPVTPAVRPLTDACRWHFAGFGWMQVGPAPGSVHYRGLVFPLWLPVLLTLLPAVLLFRRARRAPPPTACKSCGYDLRATAPHAPCPECGAARLAATR